MSKEAVKVVRNLLGEVRRTSRNKNNGLLQNYILLQCRKYQVTDEQLCKAREEMKFLAQTYLCYLRSQRSYNEIHQKFQGKGERSVKETAGLVGFKLPHDRN